MKPEERIKKLVDNVLEKVSSALEKMDQELYVHKPVPTGYGKRNTLDFHLCLAGHFIAIEAKAPGEWLTPLQRQTCRTLYRAGCTVFIISGPDGIAALERWLARNEPKYLGRS
jgi:hypothetical protein